MARVRRLGQGLARIATPALGGIAITLPQPFNIPSHLQDDGFLDNTREYVVPPGHYFVLGHNRDNSIDSRVLSQVGYVPFRNIIGRAGMVYFSIARESKPGEAHLRLDRLGLTAR